MQPVVDDLFKQLAILEPYNKGLLWALGLDLTPSKGVAQSIQHKLREIELRTEAANRGLLTQPAVASMAVVINPEPPSVKRPIHPELAAVSNLSKSKGTHKSLELPLNPHTPSERAQSSTGRASGTVRKEVGYNLFYNNMYKTHASPSVNLSHPAISTESIHSDNSAGQQLLLAHTRANGNLWRASPPSMESLLSERGTVGRTPHSTGRPLTGVLSPVNCCRLGIRGLRQPQETESTGKKGQA